MRLEDVKVCTPSPIFHRSLVIDILHPPSLHSKYVKPVAPLYPGTGYAGCKPICYASSQSSLTVQDMDMGVLFCTYSLLNQKSRSTKDIYQTIEKESNSVWPQAYPGHP